MKYLYVVAGIGLIAGGVYWYGARAGWFLDTTPTNPPTAEERARIQAVEDASMQIAPNAVPGAGVMPKGSKPAVVPEPVPVATTSATTTPDAALTE